jgi:signal transduction histidine kinase
LERTLDELHDIARGLHPRELDAGLVPALAALADRCPVPVRVTVDPVGLAAEVEAAVYYVCAEALTNIAKHADASTVSIDVGTRSDRLVATVTDDGIGGADPEVGTGLAGLADRVVALGGHLTVRSTVGGGTRIMAQIPISFESR